MRTLLFAALVASLLAVAAPARADESAWTLLKKGIDAYQRKDLRAAQAYLEASVRMDPACEDSYFYLGTIAEAAGDPRTALVHYGKVGEKAPTYSLGRARLGHIAYAAGDKKTAAVHFAASAEARPSADAWMQLATTQIDLKAYPEAETSLQKADEFTKDNPVLAEMWGRLFLETSRFAKALERYAALSKQFPRDAALRFMKGACLGELKRTPEAVAEYEAVLSMDPFHEHAIRRLLRAWADDSAKAAQCAQLEERLVAIRKNPPKVRPVSGS